jgi:uncharacterized protein YeeX (DUF496 family)
MKQAKLIESEIKEIQTNAPPLNEKSREAAKARKRIVFLRNALNYLKTNPDPDHIARQIEQNKKRIAAAVKARQNLNELKALSKTAKKEWLAEIKNSYRPDLAKEQIRLMQFVLSD